MMLFHNNEPIGCFCITELKLPFIEEDALDLNHEDAMNAFLEKPTYEAVVLQRMYIAPDYQKHGIGSTLMNMALERAHEKQLPLELEVLTTNSAGIHAYKSKGYDVYSQIDSKGWNKKYLMRQKDTEQYMPSPPTQKPNFEESAPPNSSIS